MLILKNKLTFFLLVLHFMSWSVNGLRYESLKFHNVIMLLTISFSENQAAENCKKLSLTQYLNSKPKPGTKIKS